MAYPALVASWGSPPTPCPALVSASPRRAVRRSWPRFCTVANARIKSHFSPPQSGTRKRFDTERCLNYNQIGANSPDKHVPPAPASSSDGNQQPRGLFSHQASWGPGPGAPPAQGLDMQLSGTQRFSRLSAPSQARLHTPGVHISALVVRTGEKPVVWPQAVNTHII